MSLNLEIPKLSVYMGETVQKFSKEIYNNV